MLLVTLPDAPALRVAVTAADGLVRAALPALLREGGARVEADDGTDPDVSLWTDGAEAPVDGAELPALALVDDEQDAEAAWQAGARGLLSRDADPADLVVALAAVARGLVVLDGLLAEALLRDDLGDVFEGSPADARSPGGSLAEPLTPREAETLALLAEGIPNKLVADRLGVAERTARYHVAQILAKLGAQSRTEAVVAGARLGLITL